MTTPLVNISARTLRALAVTLLGGASLGAAATEGSYVAPMASYVIADEDRHTDDAFGGVLAFGRRFSSAFGAELRGSYLDYGDTDETGALCQPLNIGCTSRSVSLTTAGLGLNYYVGGGGLYVHLDAMGGDHGLPVTVPAVARILARHPDLHVIMVGEPSALAAALKKEKLDDHPRLALTPASEVVAMDDPVAVALRQKKDSSMRVAINQVKEGRALAAVSAGNTGALMAVSRFVLKTLPGVDRPAICTAIPTAKGHCHMLDLGANTEANARNLVQFAIMGAAYSRILTGRDEPRVRLLNIGTEEIKGTDSLRDAASQLQEATNLAMSFDGFVESDKINRGQVDVVVTDGFSGNIALKAIEGAARFVTDLLRAAFTSSLRSKVGFLVSKPATELLKHHLDPNNHNGAVFLGLNGVVVKSHGSASAGGVAHAVTVAAKLLEDNLTNRIAADLAALQARNGTTDAG